MELHYCPGEILPVQACSAERWHIGSAYFNQVRKVSDEYMSLPVFSEHTVRSLSTSASFFKGKKYFYDNAVGVIEMDGDRYWARVQGSRPYRVTIYQRNGDLHAECTCPYNFGGICKHAVATMLKVILEGPKWAKEPGLLPAEMVKRMSKPELESFVVDLIGLKDGILDLLRFYYLGGKDSTSTVSDYLRQVEEVFKDEHLSIYNTRNVYEDLQPIESLAEKLKGQGNYSEASKIFEALFEGVARNIHLIEDSYGLFGEIAGHSLESLVECLIKGGLTVPERRQYVRKFWKSYERVRYEFFNENYRAAILSLADEGGLLEVLDKLDQLINDYACIEDCEWPSIYYYQQAVLFKLDILERLGRRGEFIRFAYANCDFSDVCLRLVVKLRRDGDAKAAVDTAERCSKNFSDLEAEEINRFLAEVYEERAKYDKAIEKYYEMFLALGVFEYYERLRKLATEIGIWPQIFSAIISNAGLKRGSREKILSEIYLKEGMGKEAIGIAYACEDLTVLEMVAEGVKETHPIDAYELYKRLVDTYLDRNIGRAAYQQAVGFLTRMKQVGFDIEFNSYIDELTERFWRRRALLDEISKLSA
ncbi:MAG: SWIM zinc finger family protein [Actinobacteria bacterium]|nr:SWIM zinc finger family protein [Actinomycetota bacterium]